jgi:hypothetical protein
MGEWICRSTFFLTSALVGGELSASRPDCFTPGEGAPGTHWIGVWVDLRATVTYQKGYCSLELVGTTLT